MRNNNWLWRLAIAVLLAMEMGVLERLLTW